MKNAKRKRKLKERRARQAKRRHDETQLLSEGEINIQAEINYIVGRAGERDSRCVAVASLVLFSTQTGDAWLLDPEDHFALCLARDGVQQPSRVVENESGFIIAWNRTYSIEGAVFQSVDNATGRTTAVHGYPTQAIRSATEQAKRFNRQ